MQYQRSIFVLVVTVLAAMQMFVSQVVHAQYEGYSNPYSSPPPYGYGAPDSSGSGGYGGLSHSPSRDLYGNEMWDSRPSSPSGQPHKSEPAWSPPTSAAPHDFNVFTPGEKPKLCTATKDAVYCY